MTLDEVKNLVNQYSIWLKDKTVLREVKDYVEITTPFLDRHNDHIQLYVKKEGSAFVVTDDGYTINDLLTSGLDFKSEKRQQLLNQAINGFGVEHKGEELSIKTDEKHFPQKKHNLIQAIMSINDLFYLAKPYISSLFLEDIKAWLDENEVRYIPQVSFNGKSGFTHNYDFVIPKSKFSPERVLRAINHPERQIIQYILFSWQDTLTTRDQDSTLYAIMNDKEIIKPTFFDALSNYNIYGFGWSERDRYKDRLIA